MIRSLSLVLLLSLCAPVADAAPMPESWSPADVTPADTALYSVEAGRFLSPAIAGAVAQALRDLNFSPVRVLEEAGPKEVAQVVYVGASRDLVELYGLRDELISQKLSEGRVVPVDGSGGAFSAAPTGGKFLPAFVASSRFAPKQAPTPEETMATVTRSKSLLTVEESAQLDTSLRLLSENQTRDPAVSAGLVTIAKRMYENRANPEAVLAVLAPIARGELAATPADLESARAITVELFLSHRGDWRAAWRGASELARMPNRGADARAEDLFRSAMLKAWLLAEGAAPAPSHASIRGTLQEAYSAVSEGNTRLRARIMLLYVQTFAWEGDWARVEICGNEFFRTLNKEAGLSDLAAVYVARSFERTQEYDRALRMLESVIGTRIDEAKAPRSGTKAVDVKRLASVWRDYFLELKSGATPPSRPPELIFIGESVPAAEGMASAAPLRVPPELVPAATPAPTEAP